MVDAPAQPRRKQRQGPRFGPVRQHQMLVAQRAAAGAQLAAGRRDAHSNGMRQQLDIQTPGGIRPLFFRQFADSNAARHRHRQQRFVIHITVAARDQRDGQVRIAFTQGLGHLPARPAGADDHDASFRVGTCTGCRRAAGSPARALGPCFVQVVDVRLEIAFRHAAQRAGPVVGDVGKPRAGGQTAVFIAFAFVVKPAARPADENFPRQGCLDVCRFASAVACCGRDVRCGRTFGEGPKRTGGRGHCGCHVGCSSALNRAISLRRCLMAGVTMATK